MAEKKSARTRLLVPSPLPVKRARNVTTEFESLTKRTPHDPGFMRAFAENKLYIVQTHPTLGFGQRSTTAQHLVSALEAKSLPMEDKAVPVPGGVGDGTF